VRTGSNLLQLSAPAAPEVQATEFDKAAVLDRFQKIIAAGHRAGFPAAAQALAEQPESVVPCKRRSISLNSSGASRQQTQGNIIWPVPRPRFRRPAV